MNVLKSMEIQSRHSELSIILQVSAVEGIGVSTLFVSIFCCFY